MVGGGHTQNNDGKIFFVITPDNQIVVTLLAWFDAQKRALPWRDAPCGQRDAYRVWLAEIMLQQTTVAAVIPYYRVFLENWPDVKALAQADDQDVMRAWAGLGYYARARNMLKCAREIAEKRLLARPVTTMCIACKSRMEDLERARGA